MSLWRSRRAGSYLALVAGTTVAATLLYNYGMATLENDPQPLYRSLEVVFQTFTTTGYGEDAPWSTPQMNFLMIGLQLTGIGLILTGVDIFAVPWLRSALATTPPTTASDLEDHVIVCEYSPRGDAFIEELESRGQEYVVVESDEGAARELHETDRRVVHGDPESIDVLEDAGIERARAVVADAADDTNASIVLSAQEANPEIRVVTLVEDQRLGEYHRIAGADEVLSPRQLLGESFAHRVPTAVTTAVDEGVEIGNDLELVELSIAEGSDLCGRTADAVGLRNRFGVDGIGAWFNGDFESPIPPDRDLETGTRLLVAGEPDRIDELRAEAASTVHPFAARRVVIAGYGEAGMAAGEALAATNTRVTVLDSDDKDGVDIVGDARDPATIDEVGIDGASAVIITLDDDTSAIFATLVVRDLDPSVDIIVRANDAENVQKLYRAGADYVQSLATVSGRMLASTVLEDEEVLAVDRQVDVVRLPAGELAGRTVVDADVRSRTGCTVLAAVRDGETITEFDPAAFVFEAGDEVVIAGTDESVRSFETLFLD
ncbi:TrkA-N domain protein [Natrinema pellirubrum DSM 15624]|uniref:K+ transport system, NAD-binding component n=1 Tax=Natrinema pellirubrum (strain DSM 15624 / CIP 106293 / JCM 10476 / NCIMB 786 / 157) TaxID=797303 RepID=L0JJ05_NATP1|nr:NAD-binding protein [Natrinema pellirubrum]AGB30572.1 K+ transport system, NAD-binding component [Natrinema pellirubrum DSM 15624]ELY74953.1 TrkA-N domain protein [Natrinema pellirubrum DSM 15624]